MMKGQCLFLHGNENSSPFIENRNMDGGRPLEERYHGLNVNRAMANNENLARWGSSGISNEMYRRNESVLENTNGWMSSQKIRLCMKGKMCDAINTTCKFSHTPINKPCRNGMNCGRKSTCLFSHTSGEERASLHHNKRGQFNSNINLNCIDRINESTDRTWLRSKN